MVYHERVLHNCLHHAIENTVVKTINMHNTRSDVIPSNAMLPRGMRSNIPRVTCMFLVCTREDTRENWDITCFTKSHRCITILNHATETSEANKTNTANDKDWLYTSHLVFSWQVLNVICLWFHSLFLVENKVTCSSELINLILDIVDQILERKKKWIKPHRVFNKLII